MRVVDVCRIALVVGLAACFAERPLSPGLVVLDDVGTGNWSAVSAGESHTCAIDRHGRAFCWGSNAAFQLGVDETGAQCGPDETPCSLIPVPVATGRTFSAISAGAAHTCAIATDSVPFCWGSNSQGQVGAIAASSAQLQIPGTSSMIWISAGKSHSCGVRSDNVLLCWGSNRFGAVGVGAGVGILPTVVAANQRFTQVEASDDRTCARTVGGRVLCWGLSWSTGDLFVIRENAAFVPGLGAMRTLDVGSTAACSADASGFLWCWESNLNGESGVGPGPGSSTPRRAASDEQFSSISAGNEFFCGVATAGAGYCWGTNRTLQLGGVVSELCTDRRVPCATLPTRIGGRLRFQSISAGLGGHACGVTDQLNVYCWGAGSFGQRGDGSASFASRIPRLAVSVHEQ
jgi:alpha-tubulin suppressor-like RCC1 family protein